MSADLRPLIGLAADRPLTREEAELAFRVLFAGDATPSPAVAALRARAR